jgi:hypothetical protein
MSSVDFLYFFKTCLEGDTNQRWTFLNTKIEIDQARIYRDKTQTTNLQNVDINPELSL